MARSEDGSIIRSLRWLLSAEQNAQLSDGQLLDRYLLQRDESAFAVLMRRHGRLVLGVCKRVLKHHQDAEDVFQATFVILARKANTLRQRQAIGSWLYQVAFRLANKARRRNQKRNVLERQAAQRSEGDPLADVSWGEVRSILDEELAKLPDKHRAPLLLCYLEGCTHDEAARLLGVPMCTLRARLARARELLRGRLARRGLPFGAALLATAMSNEFALARVPATIAEAVCHAATLSAMGEPITGVVSNSVEILVNGGLRLMATVKIFKAAAVMMLLFAIAGTSVGLGLSLTSAGENRSPHGKISFQDPERQDKAQQPDSKVEVPIKVDGNGDPLPLGALFRLGTQRLRHGGALKALAWSPDGTQRLC